MGKIDTINWRKQKVQEFHNLNLKNCFGKKSSTTPSTTAIVSDEIEDMPILSDDVIKKYIYDDKEINIKLNPKICYSELVDTNLTVDAACTNNKCGKSIAKAPRENCDMSKLQ